MNRRDLRKFRMEETKKLEGYGWVDEKAGVAHVPIDEAKKLILQRGLPVRASGAVEDPRMGTHAPAYGGSSSGRTIAVPRRRRRAEIEIATAREALGPSRGRPQAAPVRRRRGATARKLEAALREASE